MQHSECNIVWNSDNYGIWPITASSVALVYRSSRLQTPDTEMKMVLRIDRVFTQHFRTPRMPSATLRPRYISCKVGLRFLCIAYSVYIVCIMYDDIDMAINISLQVLYWMVTHGEMFDGGVTHTHAHARTRSHTRTHAHLLWILYNISVGD